jgi:uroporphyrinogen-III synthase
VHIVITRPKEESVNLIDNLIKLGHLVTYLPVIKIEKLETQKINFENYKAVIFTSSNAIKYINIEKLNYKIKCFCVGATTERTAKHFGFIIPFSSEVTVASLIELVLKTLKVKSGK